MNAPNLETVDGTRDIDAGTAAERPPRSALRRGLESGWISSVSFALAFLTMVVIFGALRPEVFLSARTPEIILTGVALGLPIALGVTLPLIIGDFDLSVGAVASMAGGVAVALAVRSGMPWLAGIGVALLVAVAVGLVNGGVVAMLRVSAFIVTLAMSTVALGVEYLFTEQKQLLLAGNALNPDGTNPNQGFIDLGQGALLGVKTPLIIGLILLAACWVFTRHVESGRRMYAIGSNERAAELIGIRVARLRIVAMVAASLGGAITGLLTSAQGAAYTPNSGGELLLPAFAAAFVGTTVFRAGRFTPVGTAIGLLFLETLSVGMIMLNLPTWALNVIQGAVLAIAVILSRLLRGSNGR
ncbi:MAG: ribose transport system permease protein [Solirubrobacteraceae bacterium]|nr:ribose transport system permease protein [Solirubrobacteraceae bacterium]MEA2290972.1 ribose transport system permease protein [Solirubrobacteraceae bacterium]